MSIKNNSDQKIHKRKNAAQILESKIKKKNLSRKGYQKQVQETNPDNGSLNRTPNLNVKELYDSSRKQWEQIGSTIEERQRLKERQRQIEEQRLKERQRQIEEQKLKERQRQIEEQKLKERQRQIEEQKLKERQRQIEEQKLKKLQENKQSESVKQVDDAKSTSQKDVAKDDKKTSKDKVSLIDQESTTYDLHNQKVRKKPNFLEDKIRKNGLRNVSTDIPADEEIEKELGYFILIWGTWMLGITLGTMVYLYLGLDWHSLIINKSFFNIYFQGSNEWLRFKSNFTLEVKVSDIFNQLRSISTVVDCIMEKYEDYQGYNRSPKWLDSNTLEWLDNYGQEYDISQDYNESPSFVRDLYWES